MEFLDENERFEAGVIPRELVLSLGNEAVKDFQFTNTENENNPR